MSPEHQKRRRLPKGIRGLLREAKAQARKDGSDWTTVLYELEFPHLLTLVQDSGIGPQRLREALRDLDVNDIDSTRHLLTVCEEIGSDNYPYKNERLLDATQQALIEHLVGLERKKSRA